MWLNLVRLGWVMLAVSSAETDKTGHLAQPTRAQYYIRHGRGRGSFPTKTYLFAPPNLPPPSYFPSSSSLLPAPSPHPKPSPYLATLQLSVAIEHLLRPRVTIHGPVENRGGGNEGDVGGSDPSPVNNRLRDGVALQPALGLQVEDLQLPLGCCCGCAYMTRRQAWGPGGGGGGREAILLKCITCFDVVKC